MSQTEGNLSSVTGNTRNVTLGASQQLIGSYPDRSSLDVQLDTAATAPVYLLLRPGTASATNWDRVLAPGGNWDGHLSAELWTGAVQAYSSAAGVLSVVEA